MYEKIEQANFTFTIVYVTPLKARSPVKVIEPY